MLATLRAVRTAACSRGVSRYSAVCQQRSYLRTTCGLPVRRFYSRHGHQPQSYSRPSRVGMVVRGTLFTGFVLLSGGAVATAVTELHLDDIPKEHQPYERIEWLRALSQFNPFLVSPARFIERAWNDPRWQGIGPILFGNALVFLGWRFSQPGGSLHHFLSRYFLSNPSPGEFKPASLLLSTFSHQGGMHFAFNMYALTSFAGPLFDTFRSATNRADFLAVYCAAGTLASLGSLAAQAVLRRTTPSLGASGAIFFLASWTAFSDPDAMFSIVFLPQWPMHGTSLMQGLMAFDFIGLVFGFRQLDHAAHLAGASLGYLATQHAFPKDNIWQQLHPFELYCNYRRWLTVLVRGLDF